jgi:UDP-2-acetamido-3-amino-2,3-dideoxy-glucuronate N-acetyltransferase
VAKHKTIQSIAVIGSGYWGKNLVRNFHALGALDVICDSDSAALGTIRKSYAKVKVAASYSDILANPSIRGVAIATPASLHAQMAREAILAGKDVYVEKPLCLSEEEGARLNELAKKHRRILMVGHLLWYHPAILKLKQFVDGGKLGRIQYIHSSRLNLGKLRREENVLWSFAPHDISVILGLLSEMPESIQAQGGNFLHPRISDTTVSVFDFASGVRAHVFVSWLHPFKEQKLVVVGDKNMAVFDDTEPWSKKLILYPHHVRWAKNIPIASIAKGKYVKLSEKEPLRSECQHFLECIEHRQTPRTDGEEGLRVLKVLKACQSAIEKKSTITISGRQRTEQAFFVHESAVVDANVEIGRGSKIWHFSHILSGSKLGAKCNIGQNVVIGPNVTIGNGCKIQNNVSIYEGVTLEDDVFCGPSMVFTNVVNPRVHVVRKNEFKPTRVGKGVTIGANATIVCGHHLGRYSFIGAGAVVTKDVSEHALMIGNPARRVGWMCSCGEKLPENLTCHACGANQQDTIAALEMRE